MRHITIGLRTPLWYAINLNQTVPFVSHVLKLQGLGECNFEESGSSLQTRHMTYLRRGAKTPRPCAKLPCTVVSWERLFPCAGGYRETAKLMIAMGLPLETLLHLTSKQVEHSALELSGQQEKPHSSGQARLCDEGLVEVSGRRGLGPIDPL